MRLTVNQIKERLNKATPGKWKAEITNMEEPGYEQFTKKIDIVKKEGKTTYVIARMDWSSPPRDTAEFIAHAPEDIRFLFDTIEALRQENERLENKCMDAAKAMYEAQAQNGAMRNGLNRIRERAELFFRKGASSRPRKSAVNACSWIYEECFGVIGDLHKVSEAVYHNPADVEALKVAREAIKDFIDKAYIFTGGNENFIVHDSSYWKFKEVLAAIDKVVMGE